ncbi:MAG: TatD DNase family protein [Patescibacteria group bacterium]|nr:TatD DNase family protein [Patescibacteria group bacterium]
MKYIDVHAHLHDKAFNEDREIVISEMKKKGIGAITVGTDYIQSQKAVELAEKHSNIWATVGFHPVDNKEETFDVLRYMELANHPKVVAIGECGLDYYWPTEEGKMTEEEKERQKKIFKAQIDLSIRVSKPLMLHGRPSKGSMDAYEDMLSMLYEHKGIVSGNAHFFVGDTSIAKRFLDLGFTMSFPGVVTFAKEIGETVCFVPLASMHAETDSPYATPLPHRGKRNSPLYVPIIVEKLAELKKESTEAMQKKLLENAREMFAVDKIASKE